MFKRTTSNADCCFMLNTVISKYLKPLRYSAITEI